MPRSGDDPWRRTVVAIVRHHPGRDDTALWERAKRVAPEASVVGWTAMVADESQELVGGGAPSAQAVVVAHLDERRGSLPPADALLPGLRAETYEVDQRLLWDRHGVWPEGRRGAGFTRVALPRRRTDRDAAFFSHWWTEVHGPIAQRHHPGIARYTQHVVIGSWPGSATPERGAPDGIAELHFASARDFTERMYDSEEGRLITRADVASCLDPSRGERFLLGRWTMRTPPPRPARLR